jgi:hypothetical protein
MEQVPLGQNVIQSIYFVVSESWISFVNYIIVSYLRSGISSHFKPGFRGDAGEFFESLYESV